MPLPSFFQRFSQMASSGRRGGASEAAHVAPSDVEAARVRARRRLIGMTVLVGAGVIGFPWLFETQPRPMSQDVEMVHAGEGLSVARGVASRTASGRVAVAGIVPPPGDEAPRNEAGKGREPAAADEAHEAGETISSRAPDTARADPEPKREAEPETRPSARLAAKAADKPADKGTEKLADNRYVVQFGAFADVNAARAARAKVEKLGIKTYAQQIETPAGKRIRVRVGPYSDKAEADKALATLRKAGLTGAVLTL